MIYLNENSCIMAMKDSEMIKKFCGITVSSQGGKNSILQQINAGNNGGSTNDISDPDQ